MPRNNLVSKTFRITSDDHEWWNSSFDASGCSSQSEFLVKLLERFNTPEEVKTPEIRTVEIDRTLQANEIVVNLSPAHMFALKNTVLSTPGFAESQNKIIETLKSGNRPFMYFGNLFEPEFQSLWIRSLPLTKAMTEEQKETAIKHNMSAFMVNMFLMHLVEGKISESCVNADSLKEFIRKQSAEAKARQIQEQKEKTETETP